MPQNGLKSFEVENYKSLRRSGEIGFGGIVVILGPNSSGKTNLLESLLLMEQSMDENGLNLTLNGKNLKLGEYRDIVHRQDTAEDITYRFNFNHVESGSESEKPLNCPICGKGYKEEGWYTKHIENKHEVFWEYTDGEISAYEDFPPADPYAEFSFSYDPVSKSNSLKRVELGYPEEIGALYLKSIALNISDEEVRFEVADLHGDILLELQISQDEIDNLTLDNFSKIEPLVDQLLSKFTKNSSYYGRARYFNNQPHVADQVIPTAKLHKEEISSVLNGYKDKEKVGNSKIQGGEQEELARGVINRLGSVSDISLNRVYQIKYTLSNMSHVGPLRRNPQRIYFGSGGSTQEQFSKGVNIEERIFRDTQAGTTPILSKTNDWLKETGFDCELEVQEVGVGDIYQLKVIEDGISVNVADSGFGLSQTLPILVECISMGLKKDSKNQNSKRRLRHQTVDQYLTLIEEPEIHLNPRIESAMADFFIDINESGIGLFLETHSEHILNRIQRRVADGRIDNKDSVSVYFVTKEGVESEVQNIEMDENGAFEQWPEGFFQDDLDDAIEMLKETFDKEGD